jgi:hypothetical protein
MSETGFVRRLWRLARAETPRGLVERAADRAFDRRRRRAFRQVRVEELEPGASILDLIAFPLRRLWGGTALQFSARIDREAARRTVAVLSPEAGAVRVELAGRGERLACELPSGWRPEATALLDPEFEEVIGRAASRLGATLLHCENLWGLPLESLVRLREGGMRLALSTQDFALFCPRPHLLERGPETFCVFCRDPRRCQACLDSPRAPLGFQERRRELAAELLRAADLLIFPSPYLRRAHAELFPGSAVERGLIIPPAIELPAPAAPRPGPPRRVAFAGALKPHKGAAMLPEIARRLRLGEPGSPRRLRVYGSGEPDLVAALRAIPGVDLEGSYRSGSLSGRLRRDGVDLVLLPSICPESHGLVLDECLAAGIPVLAFDHGALAERIAQMRCGAVVPLAAGADGLAALILELASGRSRLQLQPEMWRVGSPEAAAKAHLAAYASLGASA